MFNHTQNESGRLAEWRQLRNDNTIKTPLQVAEQFGKINMRQRYMDFYTPQSWPNVFEIVQEGLFDQTGITLVLAATLNHFEFIKTEELQFDVISNHITGSEGAVLVYDGNCYNFLPGEVVSLEFMNANSTRYDRIIITKDKLLS